MISGFLTGFFLVSAAGLRAATASFRGGNRADALRDAAEGQAGAARVASLQEEREAVVPALAAVHTVLMVATTIPGVFVFADGSDGRLRPAAAAAFGVAVVLLGDVIPRAIGWRHPGSLAYGFSRLLGVADRIGRGLTELSVEESEEQGLDEEDEEEELEMITSVMEFSDTIVREVMVPRTDVKAIYVDAPVEELFQVVSDFGYSRVPVVRNGIDDVIGVVILKDLIPSMVEGRELESVAALVRPVDFVPETKRVADLLREMQVSKSHLAMVVDEYGATAGLVTIEDLLEELVGEIVDEFDEDAILVREVDEWTWAVDGRLGVDDLIDLVGVELPDGEWDTVGGLVLGLAGRVPHSMESFEVNGVTLTVLKVAGRRVLEVKVVATIDSEDAE